MRVVFRLQRTEVEVERFNSDDITPELFQSMLALTVDDYVRFTFFLDYTDEIKEYSIKWKTLDVYNQTLYFDLSA